ncbi:MAG TPA: hypothetical protein PKV21_06430 [bacterium]|nr:hypothetical protein [bacterium]
MRYSEERQQEHIRRIRRVLVMKPNASILDIQKELEKSKVPIHLNKDYINRLLRKIRKERIKRMDYYTINKVLAEFQDEIEELKRRLWIIIKDKDSSKKDKILAIKELRTSSNDLFDKMFDAGIFERKLGQLEIENSLSEEERDLIKKVLDIEYNKNDDNKDNKEENNELKENKDGTNNK